MPFDILAMEHSIDRRLVFIRHGQSEGNQEHLARAGAISV